MQINPGLGALGGGNMFPRHLLGFFALSLYIWESNSKGNTQTPRWAPRTGHLGGRFQQMEAEALVGLGYPGINNIQDQEHGDKNMERNVLISRLIATWICSGFSTFGAENILFPKGSSALGWPP